MNHDNPNNLATVRAPAARSAGFTFVELCFGLVVTALVMGAVAAFTLATASGWQHGDEVEMTAGRTRQAATRLTRAVRDARLIGALQSGAINGNPVTPGAFILWVRDANNDGAIQGAECAMVEHDPVNDELRLYPAGQGDASVVLPWSVFTSPAVLTNFKVGRAAHVIGSGVTAVRFAARGTDSTSTQTPTIEYTMKLIARGTRVEAGAPSGGGGDERTVLEYGTCAIRAPAKQPA